MDPSASTEECCLRLVEIEEIKRQLEAERAFRESVRKRAEDKQRRLDLRSNLPRPGRL